VSRAFGAALAQLITDLPVANLGLRNHYVRQ